MTWKSRWSRRVEWCESSRAVVAVEVSDCDTREEAKLGAFRAAVENGWTRPRWWQWWRWSEDYWRWPAGDRDLICGMAKSAETP